MKSNNNPRKSCAPAVSSDRVALFYRQPELAEFIHSCNLLYGWCTIDDVVRHFGVTRHEVDLAVFDLEQRGFVTDTDGKLQLTRKTPRWF